MIVLKLVDKKEIYHSIDLKLGLIIALALALGKAMKKSGLSEEIAEILYETSTNFGEAGLYVMLFLVTTILAAYVTGKAAIAIMIPVGISLAGLTSLSYIPIVLTIAFAASANFMTPHGYQTNLMVFQSGDYSYRDFMKIGFPLTLLYMIVTVLCIMYFY
jgi:di/tricarboxylate transporter